MRKDHAWSDGFVARHFGRTLALSGGLLALMLTARSSSQEAPPPDFIAPESVDLTADSTEDTIYAAPSAGEVYVLSGADGSVVITLRGNTADDWFGYSVAVAGDLNTDGFQDIIIGAPKEDDGWAYAFYGPFRDDGPLLITAANADMAFNSPDPDDYEFGNAVGPVSDLTSDGIPELRIRAWFLDAAGAQTAHTYILSGATGNALFRITGDNPFDPWAVVIGDADGDGDVDQNDLDIILANQGLAGAQLTTFDGDINGDGRVDMTDYALAGANFGTNAFDGLIGAIGDCDPDTECLEDCQDVVLPPNVDPECDRFLCTAEASCTYTIGPTLMPGLPHLVEWNVEVTIRVHPHLSDPATWEVLEGLHRIEILAITDSLFRLRTIDLGPVLIKATYDVCNQACSLEVPFSIRWGDSDCDGLPAPWEGQYGLDPNNEDTDGDGILDPDEDPDADGLIHLYEYAFGTNPYVPDDPGDSDGDGVPDQCELSLGWDPYDPNDPPDPLVDSDNDGLRDAYEVCIFGTDPSYYDSDFDGLPDGWEIANCLNPLDNDSDGDGIEDPFDDDDNDGLNNLDEWLYGTDPQNPDTDGDGTSDGDEADQGSNPNDPSDGGQAPPPEDLVDVRMIVGDPSPSESERWLLKVGYTGAAAPGYGQVIDKIRKMRRGESYEIQLVHLGSSLQPPDLDYVAWVEVLDPSLCVSLADPDNILTPMPPGTPVDGTVTYTKWDVSANSFDDERAWLLPPKGDLTVYRPNTPYFQQVPVPDAIEETSDDPAIHPGAGVRFNGDDDNGNGTPDHQEPFVTGEDDLVRVDVLGEPAELPDTFKWVLKRSNQAITVWDNPTKSGDQAPWIDNVAVIPSPNSETWYIEWVNPNTNNATLELGVREVGGTEVCVVDTIALYRFRSIVIALGGRNQVPADPVNVPGNQGTFQLAIDLYHQGYDVHMYDEEIVANDGTGPPYNEIVAAVQTRQVQYVGMYGYSYGGGGVYLLANGLATTTSIIPNYACYIDAVTHGGNTEENRRPPGVMYHLNIYQPNGLFELGGGPIGDSQPGDQEYDAVNDWGLNVGHYTIDDHPQVISTVENRLKQHVPSP